MGMYVLMPSCEGVVKVPEASEVLDAALTHVTTQSVTAPVTVLAVLPVGK